MFSFPTLIVNLAVLVPFNLYNAADSVKKAYHFADISRERNRDTRARLISKPRESLNKSIVQSRLDAVRDIWAEARKTHSEIIVREDAETDAYIADNWFDRIQGVYETALDEILTLLSFFEKPEDGASVSETSSAGDNRVAKYPKIPLPKFTGKEEDWPSFCDLFTTLVLEVPGIKDSLKLYYLKSCLIEGAADIIKDVKATNANFASTWRALKNRYDNPRLIINKHLTAFIAIPQMKKESASDMRAFVDEAQRIVRSLTNMKLPTEHWDVWLVFLLADRLDPESRKLWEAELSERDKDKNDVEVTDAPIDDDALPFLPKFSDLVRFLEKRAQTLTMMSTDRKA